MIRQGHPETASGESGITRLPVTSRLMAIPASVGFKDMESSLEKAQGAAWQLSGHKRQEWWAEGEQSGWWGKSEAEKNRK